MIIVSFAIMLRLLLSLLFQFIFLGGLYAQGTNALKAFTASPGRSSVVIQWTMEGGYTCSTTSVQWSTDSLTFSNIYTYPGICGDASSPQTYSYTHETPSMTARNFYRIDLGSYGRSETVSVSVTGNYKNYRMMPVPFKDRSVITFENPENRILRLYLFDHNGQLIRISDPFQSNLFALERYDLMAGWYYFMITDLGSFFVAGKTSITDL